jgi:hypothetical protein
LNICSKGIQKVQRVKGAKNMARGGYRPGSGPQKGTKYNKGGAKTPKKRDVPEDIKKEAKAANMDPLDYMLKVMNDEDAEPERRDRMAIAAAPFVHPRKGEGKGKKDEREERAKAASSGKFSTGQPPLTRVK